ncbi:ABC transporter substrate-binding protein [Chloroflexota bacterium]
MAKRLLLLCLIGALMVILLGSNCTNKTDEEPTRIAVEFNIHAACAYVAHAKGWFEEEDLELLPVFQIYESGTAIAAALARGDIQIGYMGLIGGIMTYARGVPIKVVAGIHKYGYGLVAKPQIKEVEDLSNKTIGGLREGTVTDLLLNIMIDKYHLKNVKILRMSPSEEVIALITGRLDAAFAPEQHATTAESKGFTMLIKSQDLWSGMQGDVLVVRTDLIQNNPGLVRRLVKITERATAWINEHPNETAEIVASQLQIAGEEIFLAKETEITTHLEITPEVISRSMDRVEYSTDIEPRVVQDIIDYMVELGYIKEGIKAADILDLTYIQGE